MADCFHFFAALGLHNQSIGKAPKCRIAAEFGCALCSFGHLLGCWLVPEQREMAIYPVDPARGVFDQPFCAGVKAAAERAVKIRVLDQ